MKNMIERKFNKSAKISQSCERIASNDEKELYDAEMGECHFAKKNGNERK